MNDSRLSKNKILTKEEIEKLTFTEKDKKAVFSKIHNKIDTRKFTLKTKTAFILTPLLITAFTLIVMLQSPMKQQVLAAFPFLETFFSEHGDEGQKEAAKTNEVQHVNQTADDKGVKIEFKEIFYDGARISAIYSIQAHSGRYKGQDLDFFVFNMKVNGKALNEYGFEGGKTVEVDNNQYVKVQNIAIDQPLPEKFTLDLSIQELIPTEAPGSQTLKGNWNFSFSVERAGESYLYTPNITKRADFGELKVRNIIFAPSGLELNFERKQKTELISETGMLDYRVFDDNGKEIKQINSAGESFRYKSGIGTGVSSSLHIPVKEIPESITIKPLAFNFNIEHAPHTISITEKLPIFLPQGENGGILIKKIEKKQKETWVYFDVKGDFVEIRKNLFFMHKIKENNQADSIEKQDFKTNNNRKNQLIKFNVPYSEDLVFGSFNSVPEWIEEWEMKIPINKDELKKMNDK